MNLEGNLFVSNLVEIFYIKKYMNRSNELMFITPNYIMPATPEKVQGLHHLFSQLPN